MVWPLKKKLFLCMSSLTYNLKPIERGFQQHRKIIVLEVRINYLRGNGFTRQEHNETRISPRILLFFFWTIYLDLEEGRNSTSFLLVERKLRKQKYSWWDSCFVVSLFCKSVLWDQGPREFLLYITGEILKILFFSLTFSTRIKEKHMW